MKKHVVDASTVIAFLAGEVGADKAREYCKGALLSTVNYTEVLQKAIERKNLDVTRAILHQIQIDVVPYEAEVAATAATLHSLLKGKSISLADRACLALGIQTGFPVVTVSVRVRHS